MAAEEYRPAPVLMCGWCRYLDSEGTWRLAARPEDFRTEEWMAFDEKTRDEIREYFSRTRKGGHRGR